MTYEYFVSGMRMEYRSFGIFHRKRLIVFNHYVDVDEKIDSTERSKKLQVFINELLGEGHIITNFILLREIEDE